MEWIRFGVFDPLDPSTPPTFIGPVLPCTIENACRLQAQVERAKESHPEIITKVFEVGPPSSLEVDEAIFDLRRAAERREMIRNPKRPTLQRCDVPTTETAEVSEPETGPKDAM